MRYAIPILLGRLARVLARLRGGGSAIPGWVVLKLAPRFLAHAVERLPRGVIVVTGSNGKTTTTAMLAAVIREHGVRVFTNSAGGNVPQGVASSLLASVPLSGRLKEELAVIEIDEGFGPALVTELKPRSALLINIQIDQLNRYFEPDHVYGLLKRVAEGASESVVVNSSDENLAVMYRALRDEGAPVHHYDVSDAVLADAPHGLASARRVDTIERPEEPSLATVTATEGTSAVIVTGDGRAGAERLTVSLPARGVHYAADAAGAIASARVVLGDDFSAHAAVKAFEKLTPVYGRGEILRAHGEDVEVLMMKNPPSMQLNLNALDRVPEQLFMAVDEGTPDPSWVYDTDFSKIDHVDVLTGTKAWQIATRLAYAGIPVGRVIPDMKTAVDAFFELPKPDAGLKVALVNYELMMELRRILGFLELEGGR